jgi:hypothetical protein
MGMVGIRGIWRGTVGGVRKDRVVGSDAVQKAAAEVVAAVGTQFIAAPMEFPPFLNCTVPVGPTPLLFVDTVAVSVTLPPDMMVDTLGTTAVEVAAFVTVTVSAMGPSAR